MNWTRVDGNSQGFAHPASQAEPILGLGYIRRGDRVRVAEMWPAGGAWRCWDGQTDSIFTPSHWAPMPEMHP